jgi:DNA-binding NtrC family response regulator/tetratricopeptide (TPR) repeat protein
VTFDLDSVVTLVRRGRFREALSSLRAIGMPVLDPAYALHQVLLADVLQRMGDNDRAEQIANRIKTSPGIADSVLARCHVVLGSVSRERGDTTGAVLQLQRAATIADRGTDRELACWARLRLVATIADQTSTDNAIGQLPDVRRYVVQLGDPFSMAALHFWVAELESKRGLLEIARRHIQHGRSILREHENVWLEGSAAIDDACLCFLTSDIEGAFNHATEALRMADISGHGLTRMAALANLAHVHLALGDLHQARVCFDSALRCCEPGGGNQIAVLDGLAQFELASHRFGECERFLDELQSVAERLSLRPAYYESWSYRTRLQLLLRQNRTADAAAFAHQIKHAHLGNMHPALRLLLTALCAEVNVCLRKPQHAVALLTAALRDSSGSSVDVLAEIERVLAKTLTYLGRMDVAGPHFERAARILAIVSNLSARKDTIEDFAASLLSTQPATESSPSTHPGYRSAPVALYHRAEMTSPLPQIRADATRVVDRVRALLETAKYPELLGYEAFELLVELRCTERLAFGATREGQNPTLLAWAGCDFDRALVLAGGERDAEVLSLGSANNRHLSLALVPQPDLPAQLECLAVRKIVAAAVDLETSRRSLCEHTALWPLDKLAPQSDAIFAAETMVEIVETLKKIAPTNVSVLMTGETGTGKEVLARALHKSSYRATKPFVPFNCTAIPRELLESQMFGYRRGAFSGAHDHFPGVIRAASGGTLFLDEVGELSLDLQPKLLRFLESGEIQPLGEVRPVKVDVRIVAASNADLDRLVADGRFREDLFYRLNVVRFRIPPLRERREEIPLLVQHYLRRYSEEFHKEDLRLAEETMEYVLLYAWPGNVRQLANELRRLVALAENHAVLMPEHLSREVASSRRTVPVSSRPLESTEFVVRLDQPLGAAIEHIERAMLLHALKASAGRLEPAARALGLSRKGLYLKRSRLGVAVPSPEAAPEALSGRPAD